MAQTWSEYGFGNLGFSRGDERDLVTEYEWVNGS